MKLFSLRTSTFGRIIGNLWSKLFLQFFADSSNIWVLAWIPHNLYAWQKTDPSLFQNLDSIRSFFFSFHSPIHNFGANHSGVWPGCYWCDSQSRQMEPRRAGKGNAYLAPEGQASQKEGIHGHRTWQLRKNGSRKLTPFLELINIDFLKKGINIILHNQAGVWRQSYNRKPKGKVEVEYGSTSSCILG